MTPKSECEVLILSKKDLEMITNDYPQYGKEMRATSIIRMKRNMVARQHVENLMPQDLRTSSLNKNIEHVSPQTKFKQKLEKLKSSKSKNNPKGWAINIENHRKRR